MGYQKNTLNQKGWPWDLKIAFQHSGGADYRGYVFWTQTSQTTTKSRRRIKEFGPLSTKDANWHIKKCADVEGGREQKRHTKEMEKKAAEEEHLYIEAGMADLPPPILSDE